MDIVKAFVFSFIKAYVATHTARTIEFFDSDSLEIYDIAILVDGKFRIAFKIAYLSATLWVDRGFNGKFGFVYEKNLLRVELGGEEWYRQGMNKINKAWLLPQPTPLFISRIVDTVIS